MMAEAVKPKTKKKKSSSKPHKSKSTVETLAPPSEPLEQSGSSRVEEVTSSSHETSSNRLNDAEPVVTETAEVGHILSVEPPGPVVVDSQTDQRSERPADVAPCPAESDDTKTAIGSVRGYHQSTTTHTIVPLLVETSDVDVTSTSHDATIYADARRVMQEALAEQVSMPSYHPEAVATSSAPPAMESAQSPRHLDRLASRSERAEQLVHRKIGYREVAWEATAVRPYTESQLCALYCNRELEVNEQRIDHFIEKHSHSEGHELHELLLGYLRARTHLIGSTRDIEDLKKRYTSKSEHVWVDTNLTAKASGRCRDGNVVHGTYNYVKAVFSSDVASQLEAVLRSLQTTLHDTYVLHSYEAEMSRLQVESYLYRVVGSSPVLRDIPRNAPVQVHDERRRPPEFTAKVEEIQKCVSILFAFQRRGIKDQQFVLDTRNWLQKLVAIVHRLGTFEDHLVLLNHILRCPPGVSSWAANYLQVPFILHSEGPYPVGGVFLDHCFTILSTLLRPIKARETFLQQTRTNSTKDTDRNEPTAWVLVDSEGEEDEDPVNQWIHWRENDLVALLNQVPLGSLFRHLMAVFCRDGVDYYDARHLSDQELMRIFSVATQLVHLLRQGFKTFALSRYRQFAKRMSQVIRHTVMYVTDHLQQFFAMYPHLPEHIRCRLQVEYDQFFLRSTYSIFSSERLGAWQFMATMPYDCVSVQMLWKIIWLLHNDYKDDVAAVENDLLAVDCRAELGAQHMHLKFEERLSSMPENEVYYLLTAFANMAIARTVTDYELIDVTCTELFQISFLNERSKSQCYKWGRELLGTIATKHPFVISIVLGKVVANIAVLGKISIYLFQELPLHLWQPSIDDINKLSALIKDNPPSTPANQLGQMILSNMNWDLNEQDQLFLDIAVHRQIALTILDAYQKHIPFGKSGFLSESFRIATSLAMAIRSCTSPEETFVVWAWETAFTLRLHWSQRAASMSASAATAPDVERDPALANLKWCLQLRHPLAVYLAFAMTNLGHVHTDFCQRLDVLQRVVEEQYYEAVVQILSHVIPLFFDCGYLLWSNRTFLSIIETLLNCDSSYLKMAKSLLVSMFPGKILQTLASVIEHHLRASSLMPWTSSVVATMWTELLTAQPQWHRTENVQYLLDTVFSYCFVGQDKSDVQRVIAHKFMQAGQDTAENIESANQGAGSSITSFLSWMATGSGVPLTLVNKNTASKYHWLAYGLLEIETQNEQQLRLWKQVLTLLAADASATPESVVKRAANSLEVPALPVGHLPIYRWAGQVLEVSNDHPLLPLFWQKFFGFYLQRTATSGGPAHGSVGERFFANMSTDMPLLKRLKKRLEDLADYHRRLAALSAKQLTGGATNIGDGGPSTSSNSAATNWQALYDYEALHDKLTRLYRTFYLWLEEPRLHDPSLRLEALLADYDPARLVLIFQNSQDPWVEFVNLDLVTREREVLSEMWASRCAKKYSRSLSGVRGGDPRESATVVRELLKRVQSYDEPLPPPPIALWRPAIPELPIDLCDNPRAALDAVVPHLTALTSYARTFANRLSHHTSLDCDYVDLLPQIYRNIETEVFLQVACHKGYSSFQLSSDSGCLGPSNISLRFHEKKVISSALTRLDQNRADWLGVVNEGLLGTPQNVCIASVFIETVISNLLNRFNGMMSAGDSRASNVRAIGLNVFYHMCGSMDTITDSYPPARKFLNQCCEILGRELVQTFGDQCDRLLQMLVDAPHLANHLGPHFCPNAANAETFVQLYSRVSQQVLSDCGVQLAFVVLSKFNVAGWLAEGRPSLSDRSRLVGCLEQALFGLGASPAPEFQMIEELFRQHLCSLLLHQFPELYQEVFSMLFRGMERSSLSTQVWYDVLNAIVAVDGSDTPPLCEESSLQSIFEVCRRFGETQERFSLSALQDTLENVGERFATQRLATQDSLIFTLYTRNADHAKALAMFLGLVGQAYLVAIKKDAARLLPDSAVLHVWTVLRGAYAPWILPLEHQGKVWLPWVAGQEPLATYFVTLFASSVQYASKTLYATCSVLALFLDMYALEFANSNVKEHVWSVCHRVFAAIEWNTFWPKLASVELMTKILNCGLPECTAFLGGVFAQIGWPQVVHGLVQQGEDALVVRTLECLLLLHVRLDAGPVLPESKIEEEETSVSRAGQMRLLLEAAHAYPWHLLDDRTYDGAVRLFVVHCRPSCVLGEVEAGRQDDAVLSLLQTAAEFVPSATTSFPGKRLTYVRTCVQLLCECSTKHRTLLNTRMELFKDVVSELLGQVEVVLVTGSNRTNFFDEAVALTSEVLNVLNVATVVCLQDLAMKAVQDWLRARPRSPILGACLRAASLCLASLAHMATVIEALVDSYFSLEPESGVPGGGWDFIHTVMCVPELSQKALVYECLMNGHYLTLNALAGLLRQQCRTPEQDLELIVAIVRWLDSMKPREDNEYKLLLLWWRVLEGVQQLGAGTLSQQTVDVLWGMSGTLTLLGEDKSSQGLLGAIGFGRKSALSLRMRFCARALNAVILLNVVSFDQKSGSSDSGGRSQRSRQAALALAALDQTKANRQYASLREHVDHVIHLTKRTVVTMKDLNDLVKYLVASLFQSQHCLKNILTA